MASQITSLTLVEGGASMHVTVAIRMEIRSRPLISHGPQRRSLQ